MNNQDNEPKHMDATKPGVVPVSHTSKPALVSSPQLPYDPMMRDSEQKPPENQIQDHKKINLQPTTTKTELEKEQQAEKPESKSDTEQSLATEGNQELPEGVIENKNPIFDQQAEKIQELIDKKTYNLPIKPTKSKIMLIIGIVLTALIAIIGIVFAIFTII
jgi:hypothetical protein